MKNTLALVLLGSLAIMGCDSKSANAQNPETISVGNPDSANMMVIEEGVMVISPAAQPNNDASATDWSQEGNVEVAPAPANAPAAPATQPNNMGGVSVDESVMETSSPDTSSYQMNETISNN